MSDVKEPSDHEVARELIRRFGTRAEVARRAMEEIARGRGRPDALLTLMRAETWIALMVRR
jgi:hypothetical protein